jgi:acetyl-CoA carboxylase carboxyl transferase subunit alpha
MKTTFLDFEQPIADLEQKIDSLRFVRDDSAVDIAEEIDRLQKKSQGLVKETYSKLTPWQVAQVARHPQRPYTLDYIGALFTDWHELHGDRHYADDPAIVGGMARFNGQAVMVIGHQKGRDTKERGYRNFGMPRPEGYRKALRLMKLAEKFGMPVFTFVDTPGAFPGVGAEERGQSEAIGRNLIEMAALRVPIVTTVIGEGGSGGALAIAVGDVVMMLQYAVYSVISPEGCASILWRDGKKAPEAAAARKRLRPVRFMLIVSSPIPARSAEADLSLNDKPGTSDERIGSDKPRFVARQSHLSVSGAASFLQHLKVGRQHRFVDHFPTISGGLGGSVASHPQPRIAGRDKLGNGVRIAGYVARLD